MCILLELLEFFRIKFLHLSIYVCKEKVYQAKKRFWGRMRERKKKNTFNLNCRYKSQIHSTFGSLVYIYICIIKGVNQDIDFVDITKQKQ